MQVKSLTQPACEHKKRIMEKLFVTSLKTNNLVNFYLHALLVIRFFILVFRQKQPMVHHDCNWIRTHNHLPLSS